MHLSLSKLLAPTIFFFICIGLLIFLLVLQKKAKKQQGGTEIFVDDIRSLIRIFVAITLISVTFHIVNYYRLLNPILEHAYTIVVTICYGWIAIKVIKLISSTLLYHFNLQQKDNFRARKVHTEVRVFQRLAVAFVVVFVIVGILTTFESIKEQGVSLLASAGVVSIMVGLAAQKTMGNFFAGIQIAIAQPIRVDDVVVVENEWGRIEEIHLTFVVVKIWDLRRLIVPISYFTDHTFQNWTQKTADILGTVMLYVDYTLPIQPIREELDRLLEGNNLWDGRVKVVQVTNATEHTMEIRILVGSPNSGTSFDLRCAIREHMITFIQKNYPYSLPRVRTEISKEPKAKEMVETTEPPMEPVRAPAPTLSPIPIAMTPKTK